MFIRKSIRRIATIALSLAVITVSAAKIKSDQRGNFELIRDSEIMVELLRTLHQNYVDTLSTTQIMRDASSGISRGVDPYTTYIDERDMEGFEMMTTGKYGGIGSVIRQKGDYVTIAQPYQGSPADKAGLKIGDRIVEVDGKDAKGMSVSDVSKQLKGDPGSRVKLVVSSVVDSAKRNVTIRRERISIPAVPYAGMLNDKIGYLRHSDFTQGGYEQIFATLTQLKEQGMEGLILDYRSNGGGIMQEAIDVLSLFLPIGSEVLTVKGRQDSIVYKTRKRPLLPATPIVALIDDNSASASEIVVGALQDMDRAVVVGERSFGKGLVQSTLPLGYNSYLKLTTARYYTPSGRSIQALDYSDHSVNRKVVKVADSLKREYKTANGRSVFAGGGVEPDVAIQPEYASDFASALYVQSFIENWGDIYYSKEPNRKIDYKSFTVSDEDFESFVNMVDSCKVDYESSTSRAIKALEEAAKRDNNKEVTTAIKELKEGVHDDTHSNLMRHRQEIMQYMSSDIIMRYGYQRAVIINNLESDKEVLKAIELLENPTQMAKILTPQE